MRGYNVNIYFSEETYNKIKPLIAQRKVSEFVNKLVEKELSKKQKELERSQLVEQQERKKEKEQLRKQLIAAYKRMNKNKNLQRELATLERAATKDISRKLN